MVEKLTERKKNEAQAMKSTQGSQGIHKVPDSEFFRMMGNKARMVKK